MVELKSNAEWKQWGKDDPLFGVAAWAGKEKEGSSPWTEEEFYAVGESDWRDFVSHWQHYGVSKLSCLEIGCGAGRITKSLATYFDHVFAVDVSPEMIGCARKAIKSGNVEFSLIDGLHLPQADDSVSAIFTTFVLQHLDNKEIGFEYFREFFRVLSVGGTVMVGLPLYQFPVDTGLVGALISSEYALQRVVGNVRAGIKRGLGKKTMRGTQYPMRPLREFLTGLGFKKIEFRIFPVTSNGFFEAYVFATK
jgi:ubiquinone/menaquinone biosynthesis C-methylase UbiE